jgi:hypothetical protein
MTDALPGLAPFTDVNAKLAVIEVLMFEKGLLGPTFDVHRFCAEQVPPIDPEGSGWGAIPEVLAHFAGLPIPRELLADIDEIYMDGGNRVYLEVAPGWDGEDDLFDLRSVDDLALLPNLRKVTLMGGTRADLEALQARGIEADFL